MKGNPFKRGETWTFIYYVYDKQGHRKQKWKGGYATKKEAEVALMQYKYESLIGARSMYDKENLTIELFLKDWFDIHKRNLQANSVNIYYNNIHNHILPNIGRYRVKDITPMVLKRFYYDLLDQNVSSSTISKTHIILNLAFKSAIDEGLLFTNPCSKVKPPKITKYQATLLSKDQMRLLLSYLSSDQCGSRLANAIILAMILGIRRGEVLGLKISDIDFEQHTLTIQRQVTMMPNILPDKKSRSFGIKSLKTDNSNRTLFISNEVEEVLRKQIIDRNIAKEFSSSTFEDEGLLFCTQSGSPIHPNCLGRDFKKALKKCGLPSMRFHDLRHSYATLCVDMNIPIKAISQSLGHSSIITTDSIYASSIAKRKDLSNIISKELFTDNNN